VQDARPAEEDGGESDPYASEGPERRLDLADVVKKRRRHDVLWRLLRTEKTDRVPGHPNGVAPVRP
jgi:hypothetical protein